MASRFRLVDEGVEVRLSSGEVLLLSDVNSMLAGLGDPAGDAGAARLSPPVYLDDPQADAEWRRLAGTELEQARRADRSALELILEALETSGEAMSEITVSVPEAQAMMRVLNDARLVLAARWGVEAPEDYDRLRPEADEVLSFLGWLVSDLAIVLGDAVGRA